MKSRQFCSLALELLGPLFNYAFRLTRNREEAEELVQDTFERAFAHVDTFAEPAAVRPMMFRILHNQFVNQWWARKRRPALISFDDLENSGSIASLCVMKDFEPRILRDSLCEEVELALSNLNEAQRTTIWLREIEEFSYEEIAHVTSVPVGTVRSRLARARVELARQLLNYAKKRGFTRRKAVDQGEEQ